ncbi:MAG: hypothetical protein LBR89_01215 [Holosporales bacterium]|jgi:hypothetical protein|nr:hypothetical protein [Holosporales bacterium]
MKNFTSIKLIKHLLLYPTILLALPTVELGFTAQAAADAAETRSDPQRIQRKDLTSHKMMPGYKRLGIMHKVVVRNGTELYTAKYCYDEEEAERLCKSLREALVRFARTQIFGAAPIPFYCDPIPGHGVVIVQQHFECCLKDILARRADGPDEMGQPDPTTLEKVMFQTAYALIDAQEHGYVHDSLRPNKIYIDDEGNVQIKGWIDASLLRIRCVPSERVGDRRYTAPDVYFPYWRWPIEKQAKQQVYSLALIIMELIGMPLLAEACRTLADSGSSEVPNLAKFPQEILGKNIPFVEFLVRCVISPVDTRPTLSDFFYALVEHRNHCVPGANGGEALRAFLATPRVAARLNDSARAPIDLGRLAAMAAEPEPAEPVAAAPEPVLSAVAESEPAEPVAAAPEPALSAVAEPEPA